MTKEYDDIINLSHHISSRRKRMSLSERAAQFAPFSALTGYSAAITETGRLTDIQPELGEHCQDQLDQKLQHLTEAAHLHPQITVLHFIPDSRKSGGAFTRTTGTLKRIDTYQAALILTDGTVIPLDRITDITY